MHASRWNYFSKECIMGQIIFLTDKYKYQRDFGVSTDAHPTVLNIQRRKFASSPLKPTCSTANIIQKDVIIIIFTKV